MFVVVDQGVSAPRAAPLRGALTGRSLTPQGVGARCGRREPATARPADPTPGCTVSLAIVGSWDSAANGDASGRRRGERARSGGPSLAAVVDKGAVTHRLGYALPMAAPGCRPDPKRRGRRPIRRHRAWPELRTRAHIPVAWAAPTQPMRQAPPGPPRGLRGWRVRNPTLRTMAQLPLAWAAPRRRLRQAQGSASGNWRRN